MNYSVGIEMQAVDQSFCMSVGGDVLFLQRVYDPDQLWLPFVRAIYPREEAPLAEEKPRKVNNRNVGWSADIEPQYTLDFIEGKKISKNHRKKLHKAKFPTFDRRKSGALLELAIVGEPQGRKLRSSRNHKTRDAATQWCMSNLRGRFVPDRYFVFELADDYALALLDGRYFTEVKNVIRVC